MDHSPASILRQGYEAFNRRDAERLRRLMVEDFHWQEAEEVPGRKICTSADEFLTYMMGFDRMWTEFEFEIRELEEAGDGAVVATLIGRGRGLTGGSLVEIPIHHVWRFRDGLVCRMDAFLEHDEALAAAQAAP